MILISLFLDLQESEAETDNTDDEEMEGSPGQDNLENGQQRFLLKLPLFLAALRILCEGLFSSAGKLAIVLLLGLAGRNVLHYFPVRFMTDS